MILQRFTMNIFYKRTARLYCGFLVILSGMLLSGVDLNAGRSASAEELSHRPRSSARPKIGGITQKQGYALLAVAGLATVGAAIYVSSGNDNAEQVDKDAALLTGVEAVSGNSRERPFSTAIDYPAGLSSSGGAPSFGVYASIQKELECENEKLTARLAQEHEAMRKRLAEKAEAAKKKHLAFLQKLQSNFDKSCEEQKASCDEARAQLAVQLHRMRVVADEMKEMLRLEADGRLKIMEDEGDKRYSIKSCEPTSLFLRLDRMNALGTGDSKGARQLRERHRFLLLDPIQQVKLRAEEERLEAEEKARLHEQSPSQKKTCARKQGW